MDAEDLERAVSANDHKELRTSDLLARGFREMACWSVGEQRLNPPRDLPPKRGVYAFAIGDRVVYVGLASRSLKQRLGFYARPDVSQRTNVRLNETISQRLREGQTVRILIAQPADAEWNGWRMSGAEALEAALIEDFDLPWNKKGTTPSSAPTLGQTEPKTDTSTRRAHGTTRQAIYEFVASNPKCTELEIAKGVFGPNAVQPRANSYVRRLVDEGRIERLATRPARYVIKQI